MNKHKLLNICDKLTGFSFYLLAVGLTFSNSFTEIASYTIIGLWIIVRTARRRYRLPGGSLAIILSFFILWNLISFINTQYLYESFRGFLKVFKYSLIFFAAIDYFNTKERVRRFLLFGLGVGFFIALNGIAQHIMGVDIIRQRAVNLRDSLYRISSSFRHSNDFGAYLVVITTIFMSLIFSKTRPFKQRVLTLFAMLPLIWCLKATGSRGAWVSFIAALLTLSAMKSKRLLALILVLIIASPLFLPSSIKNRFSDLTTIRTEGTVWERTRLWSGTINMVKDHPFLGFGVNTYTKNFTDYKPKDYPDLTYPHNSYLHMAAEIGVVGAGTFLLFLLVLMASAIRATKNLKKGLDRDLYLGLIAGIVGFLVHSIVDTHLYSVVLASFLYLYLGVIVASRNIIYEKNS